VLSDNTPSFLSLADFGRLHGVAGATVTGWKRRGYLVLVDGKVDVVASNARLAARPSTLRGGTAKVRPGKPVEPGPAVESSDPANWSRQEASRQREIAQARLAQIEADRAAGKVALIEEVTEKVGKRFSIVRARMLTIPSKLASRLAVLNTAEACGTLLDIEIRAALTELSTIP
jgi:hypothetical protein